MAPTKKNFVLPELKGTHQSNGNWYVEYCMRDIRTDELVRKRVYTGLSNKIPNKIRMTNAEKIIKDLQQKMITGEIGFPGDRTLTYEDELAYKALASRWGNTVSEKVTIRTYLSEFLSQKKVEVIAHSYQTYQSKLRIFAEWCDVNKVSEKHIAFITQEEICNFLRYMVSHNHSSRHTINKYAQLLRTFFNYLIEQRNVAMKNPVHHIPKMGRVVDDAPRPMPDNIRWSILRYMQQYDPQMYVFCQMIYFCAIRPNELRFLTIGDFDLTRGTVTVPKDIAKNRMRDTVEIPRQMMDILREMNLEQYPSTYYLFGADRCPGSKHIGKNNTRYRFESIRKKLGIPTYYKLYSFKHTGACNLIAAGVSTWELQHHMRHSSIAITEAYIKRAGAIHSKTIRDEFPD